MFFVIFNWPSIASLYYRCVLT